MPKLTQLQKEFIFGTLLGDACLSKRYTRSNSCLRLQHCIKQREYLNKKHHWMAPFSLDIKDGEYNGNKFARFSTRSNALFSELESKWYLRKNGQYVLKQRGKIKERIKIIPRDEMLTPFALAILYWDDGYWYERGRRFTFCTENFLKDDFLYLKEMIENLGFKCGSKVRSNGGRRITISEAKNGTTKFLDMVTPYVSKCFHHKINLQAQ